MKKHEEIQKLAYDLFEKSGKAHGRDMDHWLEAERLLSGRQESEHAKAVEAAASKERPHERSDARWHEARKTGKK
ncbi:MAG: DUF2934 domain-containing protein [Thermodesulfovibrionales bacterium]|jgi:hypothetical protein